MVMVSIELITKGEDTLIDVLESIKNQTFNDYEIICTNSAKNIDTSELLKKYNVKEIKTEELPALLAARYLSNLYATGEYRLILDSTRPLKNNALEILTTKYNSYSAVCIKEGSVGKGFWVNQANILKILSEGSFSKLNSKNVAYLLPRFYKSNILNYSFKFLKENIDKTLFSEISYGEHHLIYDAAKLKNEDIALTDEILLDHYEDSSLSLIIKKYKWYGKSQRTLNKINFNNKAKTFKSHVRPFSFNLYEIETIPIRFIRVISFLYGYLLEY